MMRSVLRQVIALLLVGCLLSCTISVTAAQGLERDEKSEQRATQLSIIVDILTSVVDILIENQERNGRIPPSLSPVPSLSASADKNNETPAAAVTPTPNMAILNTPSAAAKLPTPAASVPTSYDIPSVPYELTVLHPPQGKADSAIVVLHGLGSSPESIFPLVSAIREGRFNSTKFILPQASTNYVKLYNETIPSWFSLLSNEIDGPQAEEEIIEAAQNIANIAEIEERVYGIDRSKIAVLGISQGGALVLTTYLRHNWAGAVCLSGYLPLSWTYPDAMTSDSASSPVLMINGELDQIVPIEGARLSQAAIESYGRDISYTELEGEDHRLSGSLPQVISASVGLLSNGLA